jgi:hypothetical protein
VIPSLASSWRQGTDGSWILTLRENARFTDGQWVRAEDVLSSWLDANRFHFRPEVRRLISSVSILDDRTLSITLRNPNADAPLPLAHADLAIARRVPGVAWPYGTRGMWIPPDGEAASAITITRSPPETQPEASPLSPVTIRFLLPSGRDGRDMLDAGADLLITREPRVLDYAATLPQFASQPLAWRQTHVLIAPGRPRGARTLSSEERRMLAAGAVRGESRGAEEPFWWENVQACRIPVTTAQTQPSPTTGRVVYQEGDTVARDLAERLVGLGSTPSAARAAMFEALSPAPSVGTYQRATGISSEGMMQALRGGSDAAFILALDSRPLDRCREMQALSEAIPWLDAQSLVPLVDTRLQVIVRRGRWAGRMDWDGGLLLSADAR